MCGIAGMAGTEDAGLLQQMLELLRHRGPDDSGTYLAGGSSAGGRVALGNDRLSILDLSPAGHQPMCNEDGTIWVVYNGEIFNYRELRAELEVAGHRFRSNTDTEILPHIYEACGRDMVKRLNGMFAFALWDSREHCLYLFRDRFGIKPLYYAEAGGRLYFASEIKALLCCPGIEMEIDFQSLLQYLALLYIPNPGTLLQGIRKLPPGHFLVWKEGTTELRRYWHMEFGPYRKGSTQEVAKELLWRLSDAVRRQLVSDVPVGFFLSGGIDSSSLLACAAEQHSGLKAYCISLLDKHSQLEQSVEDRRFARIVAERFGAQINEIVVEPDVVDLLPRIVWHLDDPVADPASIATFLVSLRAKREVTVLISGQGADELMGGYRVHLAHRLASALRLLPRLLRRVLAEQFLRHVEQTGIFLPGVPFGLSRAYARYFGKLLRTVDGDAAARYANMRTYLPDADRQELLSCEARRYAAVYSDRHFARRLDHCPSSSPLEQMLYVDATTFLPDLNLAYSDRLSMACSIEARVPFLDNEVVDFLLAVRPSLKVRGLTQKYLLKAAMRGVLPNGVIRRRKTGFGLPVRTWLRGDLRPMVRDLLSTDAVRRRGLFDPQTVARMIQANEQGSADFTYPIWALLTLEIWQATFRNLIRPAQYASV